MRNSDEMTIAKMHPTLVGTILWDSIWTLEKLADIHSDLEEVGENFTQDRPREHALSGSLISKLFFLSKLFLA